MYSTIIKQLEKALECKDDKELRLRVEVLLDMIKDQGQPIPTYIPPQPIPQTTYEEIPRPTVQIGGAEPTVTGSSSTKITGAGSITSVNSEQINYKRPKGT